MVCSECVCGYPSFFEASDVAMVEEIVNQVREHYDVTMCIVSFEVRGQVMYVGDTEHLFAMFESVGADSIHRLKRFELFRFNVSRDLPIIIADTSTDERFVDDHLVSSDTVRFYSSAPLILRSTKNVFVGALCIADAKPRHAFLLDDCAMLEAKAREIAARFTHASIDR
eukprot:TRINITY_DN65170_c0_g1_i1.p1 TRINITY_DN65170_c0_g1~~TRINITY_DN65170_c0_g1_i1.p1  ORF type:complete len:169 (-),score=18.70 TRINITY_DN65170_c0_g1_i1:17-523(-)